MPSPFRYPQNHQCRKCAHVFSGVERVRRNFSVVATGLLSNRCAFCAGDCVAKNADPFRRKAQNTQYVHVSQLDIPLDVLRDKYGWDATKMAADIRAAGRHNFCPYCENPIHSGRVGYELGLLSLDVVDVTQPPRYGRNTLWVCRACNSQKGDKTPEAWAWSILDRQDRAETIQKNKEVRPLFMRVAV